MRFIPVLTFTDSDGKRVRCATLGSPAGASKCPYVFHRNGRALRDFRATWVAACKAVGLPGLLFHDLRRSGARNYRRAQVTEDTTWSTSATRPRPPSACRASLRRRRAHPPTIVPLAAARAPRSREASEEIPGRRTRTKHGQSRLFSGCTGGLDGRKVLNSIPGEGRGPVASPVFKTAMSRQVRDGRFDSFPSPPLLRRRGDARPPAQPSHAAPRAARARGRASG